MKFTRNGNTKKSLNIGLYVKIPGMLSADYIDHTKFLNVIDWSIENDNLSIYEYMVSQNGQTWYGEKISIRKYINEILWDVINEKDIRFIKPLLEIPNLFSRKCLCLDKGHIHLKDKRYKRGRIILFAIGFYYSLALRLEKNDIADLIKKYFEKSLKKVI